MLNLLSKADIFVTSLRSGALKRLGLDYETLHEKFPRLVWAQNRGYGEFGPLKDAKGFDATAFAARSGFVSAIPQANEHYEPGNSPIAFGDWNTGCALAAGILGAYACALKTGVGDKVTGSLYHVGTWGMTSAIIAQQQGCDYPKDRMEAKCPTNNSYVSSDGIWFLMCFGHYNKYHELVFKTLEMDPVWYTAEEYSTLEILADNGKYVDVVAAMHKACKKFTFAELEKRFRENDIPF
jgi:crotonobetainyl-CoA:carnitine CoA-transferase CaiB-like acyl-CoA transferase